VRARLEIKDQYIVREVRQCFLLRGPRGLLAGCAIAAAVKHDGPCIDRGAGPASRFAMPPTISHELAKEFGRYTMKAVLNDCVYEIIDLASVNLFH